MFPGVFLAAALCFVGCGGSPGGNGVLPGPHVGVGPSSPPGGPTPTPPPSGSTASYQGCTVFTAGDWYNQPVTSAALDPNSSNYIASSSAVDTSGFYLSTGVEKANVATSATPTWVVHALVSYHQNEWDANPQWPWQNGYFIEPLSDKHAIAFVVTPPA